MPPWRKNRYAASDASSSNIDPRLRGPSRRDANVSLSSTVGAPTPARRTAASSSSSRRADISLASTVAPSTPAVPKKRGRPPKNALTTPAMRALASADTSYASTSARSTRPRGRPPKSILSTPGSRTLTSPNASVSFSEQPKRRGRPPKSASSRADDSTASASVAPAPKKRGRPPKNREADTSAASVASSSAVVTPRPRGRPPKSAASVASPNTSTTQKRRGRPPGSVNKPKPKPKPTSTSSAALGLPKSKSAPARPPKHSRPLQQRPEADEDDDEGDASEVSLVDGVSDEESEASEGDPDQSDGGDATSGDEEAAITRRTSSKKRKGWPSEKERLRKWRRLSVQERECVTSEGGLIWRTAIPLLNSMPKNIRSMVADSLTRALNRIDAKLETGLVPPLARLPTAQAGAGMRRDLASSMLSWRLEEEGSLLRTEQPDQNVDLMGLGMNADIVELEQTLLPEAEQIVELSKTLTHQTQQLEQAQERITTLKRNRRLVKSAGSSDYPPNLDAHSLLSITAQNSSLDPALASALRLAA